MTLDSLFLAPFRADRATAVLGIVVRMTVDNLRQKAAAAAHGMSVNTTVRALTAYDHSDWVNAPSAKSWHLYHVFHGQIDFGVQKPHTIHPKLCDHDHHDHGPTI